jgi:hypothetical protein
MSTLDANAFFAQWLRLARELVHQHPPGSYALVTVDPFALVSVHSGYFDALEAGHRRFGVLDIRFYVQRIEFRDDEATWLARREAAEAEYASWVNVPAAKRRSPRDLAIARCAKELAMQAWEDGASGRNRVSFDGMNAWVSLLLVLRGAL